MKRYKTKPIIIQAMQYTSLASMRKCMDFCPELDQINEAESTLPRFGIRTLEGVMEIRPMDYIIKGIHGEFYPCKPDIFEATYDLVIDS